MDYDVGTVKQRRIISPSSSYFVTPTSSPNVNLLLKTQAFDDPAWGKNSITVSADATTAPDSSNTADLLTNTAGGTPDAAFMNQYITDAAGQYTFSIYIKINTSGDWVRLFIQDSGGPPTNNAAWFNITLGTTGNTDSGVTSSIVSVGSGWYRCIMTYTVAGANPGVFFEMVSVNGTDIVLNGANMFLWGAQLQTGSSATTYEPHL